MGTDFPAERLAIEDLPPEAERLVLHVAHSNQRLVITSGGRDIAVMQSADDLQHMREQLAFMRAVVQGLVETEEEKGLSLQEARERLGLAE